VTACMRTTRPCAIPKKIPTKESSLCSHARPSPWLLSSWCRTDRCCLTLRYPTTWRPIPIMMCASKTCASTCSETRGRQRQDGTNLGLSRSRPQSLGQATSSTSSVRSVHFFSILLRLPLYIPWATRVASSVRPARCSQAKTSRHRSTAVVAQAATV